MKTLAEWTHAVTELPERGLSRERAASADERAAIARDLDLVSCDGFVFDYRLVSLGGGRVRLSGKLTADVTQRCVVSLAPVRAHLLEPVDVEFWPAHMISQQVEGETEILSGPEIEPIDNGMIAVGRIAFEVLSASLDPYPRAEGVEFDWNDPRDTEGSESNNPFAALSRFKRDS
jgi:hypothetical protein